jgi:hypothetical protein
MTTRYSGTDRSNPQMVDWTADYREQDNMRFFADALAAFAHAERGNGGLTAIGLVGQRDLPGVTMRWAQSVLRWDLRPSLWSHAFLLAEPASGDAAAIGGARVREVPLFERTGAFPRPERNGVSDGRLDLYRDARVDANVALLTIDMSAEEAQKVAEQALHPNRDRIRYNLWEILGVWETYLWATDTKPNPLRQGVPVCASAFIEYAFEAIALDLSPGASERNSAPEHLWNAAKWWHGTFQKFGHPISGYYVTRDRGCAVLDPSELPDTVPPAPPAPPSPPSPAAPPSPGPRRRSLIPPRE